MARSQGHHGPPFKHVHRLTFSGGSDFPLRRRRGLIKVVKVKLSPHHGGRKLRREVKRKKNETVRENKQETGLSHWPPPSSLTVIHAECGKDVICLKVKSIAACLSVDPPSSPCLLFLAPLVLCSTLLRSALFSRHLSVHLNFISQMTGFSVMQQLAERGGSAQLP